MTLGNLGYPTADPKVTWGAASPEKPALKILDPLAKTRTVSSTSFFLLVLAAQIDLAFIAPARTWEAHSADSFYSSIEKQVFNHLC